MVMGQPCSPSNFCTIFETPVSAPFFWAFAAAPFSELALMQRRVRLRACFRVGSLSMPTTTEPVSAEGWAGTGLSKDQEQLIVPRRSGNLHRTTLKRAFYSKCLGCEYENNTTGAVGGGTQHAEHEAHDLLVVYYAEYKYSPSKKGEKAVLARKAAHQARLAKRNSPPKTNPLVQASGEPIDLDAAILRAAQSLGLTESPVTNMKQPKAQKRVK